MKSYEFWDLPFGGYESSCARLEPRTITDSMNEQIKFCNSQGLSFKISAWDGMIKCIPID